MQSNGKNFSTRLRTLRNGKSQREFSEIIGVKQQTYSGWEQGKRTPKLTELCRIATTFCVSTDWLLGLSDDYHGIHVTGSPGAAVAASSPNATITAIHDSPSAYGDAATVAASTAKLVAELRRELKKQEDEAAKLLEIISNLSSNIAK